MKISMVIYGTRGDVQPMLALAIELKKAGHEIILCAPPENEELVKSYNCPFVVVGTSLKDKLAGSSNKTTSPKTRPSAKFMKQEITNQIEQLPGVIKGSDIVLGVGYVFGVPVVADYLNIMYRFMAFYPAILGGSKNDPLHGRILWQFGKQATNAVLKSFINKKRKEFGLRPISDIWASWMGDRVIIASFPALGEVREGLDFKSVQTGYMFLPPKTGLTNEAAKFLESGTSPVFIGFGSNPIQNTEQISHMLTETIRSLNQRFIISKGWAGLKDIEGTENCLFVDEEPYELLFPEVSVVVHHGGTGTMAAAAKAGVPQVAFPFMADQFQNRSQIVKLGLGPKTCDFKKISSKVLSEAITECISNENYSIRAKEIADMIKDINGTELTVKVIEEELGLIRKKIIK
jgi:vancomycin aglycone glucosyltransferase